MSILIPMFIKASALSEFDIRKIINSAPERYKTYAIRKRNGIDRRVISQPARELKTLQRAIIKNVLENLPIHSSATAYISGKSIMNNVIPHVNSGPILKFDFSNFFPSIQESDWILYCQSHNIFEYKEDK